VLNAHETNPYEINKEKPHYCCSSSWNHCKPSTMKITCISCSYTIQHDINIKEGIIAIKFNIFMLQKEIITVTDVLKKTVFVKIFSIFYYSIWRWLENMSDGLTLWNGILALV
jgi:hypothetical protein